MLNVDELTVAQVKQIQSLFPTGDHGLGERDGPWRINQCLLIRTVTNYWTGRIVGVHPDALVLADAAWIADTGRFSEALRNGLETLQQSEIEPVDGSVIVTRGAIIDAVPYDKPLPRSKK